MEKTCRLHHLHIIFNYHRAIGMGGHGQGRFQQRYVRSGGVGGRRHVGLPQPQGDPAATEVQHGTPQAPVEHEEQCGVDDGVHV